MPRKADLIKRLLIKLIWYYMERGETKSELGDFDGAIVDYDKAIELKPKYAIAYHNRGLAKEALGQHDAAKVDFEKAKEIDPEVGKLDDSR